MNQITDLQVWLQKAEGFEAENKDLKKLISQLKESEALNVVQKTIGN